MEVRERERGTSINLDRVVTIVTEAIANDLVNEIDAWRIRVTRRTSERDIITARGRERTKESVEQRGRGWARTKH